MMIPVMLVVLVTHIDKVTIPRSVNIERSDELSLLPFSGILIIIGCKADDDSISLINNKRFSLSVEDLD